MVAAAVERLFQVLGPNAHGKKKMEFNNVEVHFNSVE